jgi:small multidrug resistance pump
MPAWLYLVGAIVSEVCGTVTLPFTDGLRRPGLTMLMLACYGLSIWLLALALKSLDLGLSYAIWAGSGTALVAIIGMVALGEPVNALKLLGIVLVVAGIVSLNLAGAQ